jgi:hypothetical protein
MSQTRQDYDVKIVFWYLVKQSHYRPGQARTVPGGWGSQISRQSSHEGGKVVSPRHRPLYPSGNTPGTHFFGGWVKPRTIKKLERLGQWKIPTTPSGMEPTTFRLVEQCLKLWYFGFLNSAIVQLNISCKRLLKLYFIFVTGTSCFNIQSVRILFHRKMCPRFARFWD